MRANSPRVLPHVCHSSSSAILLFWTPNYTLKGNRAVRPKGSKTHSSRTAVLPWGHPLTYKARGDGLHSASKSSLRKVSALKSTRRWRKRCLPTAFKGTEGCSSRLTTTIIGAPTPPAAVSTNHVQLAAWCKVKIWPLQGGRQVMSQVRKVVGVESATRYGLWFRSSSCVENASFVARKREMKIWNCAPFLENWLASANLGRWWLGWLRLGCGTLGVMMEFSLSLCLCSTAVE